MSEDRQLRKQCNKISVKISETHHERRMKSYENLRTIQYALFDKVTEIHDKYFKTNYPYTRRETTTKETVRVLSELKEVAEKNHFELQILNATGIYSQRGYFVDNTFKDLVDTIDEKVKSITDHNNKQKAVTMNDEQFLKLIEQMEIDRALTREVMIMNRTNREAATINQARNNIDKFDKKDVVEFLSTAKTAYAVGKTPEEKAVISEVARSRIRGSVLIAGKTYETFEAFEKDVLAEFRPQHTTQQVGAKILAFKQAYSETVDEYAKRGSYCEETV